MPVLSLACHLPHNTPHIPSHYNNEQTTKQTKAINNSYIYMNISCKCDTNRAGHFTLDAYASRPVACWILRNKLHEILIEIPTFSFKKMHLKLLSAKWWPFCLGLNVLNLPMWSLKEHENYMPSKVQAETTYPFPNFKGRTVEV